MGCQWIQKRNLFLSAQSRAHSTQEQDDFARTSYQRALDSIAAGKFKDEIVPVEIKVKKETKLIDTDEDPFKAKLEKLGDLKPAFDKEGTVTAGNASTISDGASALVLSSKSAAERMGAKPLARILAQESHAQSPQWFTTAPVGAVQKLMKKAKITDFRFHDLRHDFASRLVMNGVDLYRVKELLGHGTIEITQRYAHLAPHTLAEAVEVLA